MLALWHALLAAAPVAAEVLLASVWQGTLLTAGVWLCLRLLRGLTPGVRSAVWSAVLVLLLCLPLLQLLPWHAASPDHRVGAVHVQRVWAWWLLALWLSASGWRAALLLGKAVSLFGLLRRATPVTLKPAMEALLQRGRRARVYRSAEINRPSVVGIGRPALLLPPALLATLSEAELEQVLLHEMEHLRRYDDWIDLLQGISLVLLPLHPALFWLDRQLCQERELACDDGVLRATGAPRAYAACLVKLAEASLAQRGIAVALSALGPRARQSELLTRVRRILTGATGGAPTRRARLSAVGAVVFAMLLAAVLANSPEVVRFDYRAAAAPITLAVAAPANVTPHLLNAELPYGTPAVRPVLASAVMTNTASCPRLAAVVGHHRLVRRTARGAAYGASYRRARAVVEPAPARPAMERRVVLTGFELPQPLYAAVPWRDGWLIVQL